jgi:hypothetical protein
MWQNRLRIDYLGVGLAGYAQITPCMSWIIVLCDDHQSVKYCHALLFAIFMIGGAIIQLATILIGYSIGSNPVIGTYTVPFGSVFGYCVFWLCVTLVEIVFYAYCSMCLFAYSSIKLSRKKRRVIREGKY